MRFVSRRRAGVSSIVGSIFFVLIMIVAIASLVTIFNSFTAYNQQVNKVSNSNLQAADTQLSVTSGQFGAFPPSTTSNFNVATTCATTSTQTANTGHLFYAANMWWDFYTCNGAFQYSTSFDGVTWQAETSMPGVITAGYTAGPYWNIDVVGTTIYLAIARVGAANFQLGIGTLSPGGTDSAPTGTISWASAPAQVATTANVVTVAGPIQMEVDSSGNIWVATVQGATAIGVYERQACSSGTSAANGWEPNACSSAAAPTNYAPAALTGLSANANMIMMAAPSTVNPTGVAILFETGSGTVPSTGALGLLTAASAPPVFNPAISMASLGFDYSLTSSSAVWISKTIYFAGLGAVAPAGAITGTLRFWTVTFTSMSSAVVSSDATNTNGNPIEGGTQAWEAAVTSSETTLAIFDGYPTASTINYHTSSTLGSTWSSAITLESAETAVNGLDAASGGLAVTWANAAPNVRFAALSTFTLSNSSPFGVHVVDAYVYQTSANLLVAHWYYNATGTGAEDFDWWVGQGSTMSVPLRFIWAANSSYLVTFSTDTGVTAQTTLTTLPGGTVSCPSGQFFYEISPSDNCASANGATSPILISGSGENTCTDTTTGTALMMDLGLSYTTSTISSGNLYFSLAFQVASTAGTSGITTTWQLYYGSGTAPACDAAVTGTPLGQAYTVKSQSTTERALAQSEAYSLSGLAPGTTYWFDVAASDSSGVGWTYSNPDLPIVDVQTTDQPKLTTTTNANTCTDTTNGAIRMAGLSTTFTTGGAGFTGNVFGKLTFNVAGAATSGISTTYQIAYGTGAAPACNAGSAGTAYGNSFTITSQAYVPSGAAQKAGFLLKGLTPSTTYWVDLQVTDSSGAAWVYSNPVLTTMEMPTAASNSLPNVATDTFPTTCTVTTANTYKMAGFGLAYNVPSTAAGDLYVTLTFQVTTPATNNVNSQWQATWGTGAAPTCNSQAAGVTVGNTYTVFSQSGTAGAFSQSETFVISDIHKVVGATIWFDLTVTDRSTANWRYSNAEMSVAEFPSTG